MLTEDKLNQTMARTMTMNVSSRKRGPVARSWLDWRAVSASAGYCFLSSGGGRGADLFSPCHTDHVAAFVKAFSLENNKSGKKGS